MTEEESITRARELIEQASQMQKRGPAAFTSAERKLVIEWLDDRSFATTSGMISHDTDWYDGFDHVAEMAIHTLARCAPDAAIPEVARAMAWLAGQTRRVEKSGYAADHEIKALPSVELLHAFGPALIGELRSVAEGGPEQLRAGAAAVVAIIDEDRAWLERHIGQLCKDDALRRREACVRLRDDHGPRAAEAVPALIGALDDDEVAGVAISALGKVAPLAGHDAIVRALLRRPDLSGWMFEAPQRDAVRLTLSHLTTSGSADEQRRARAALDQVRRSWGPPAG